jgi:hypothetical protein
VTVVTPLCDSLTVQPSTLYTGGSINYTCNANPTTGATYSIVQNGVQVSTNAAGTLTFATAGSYTLSCLVNGGTQVPACQKTITVSTPTSPYIIIDKRDANPSDLDGIIGTNDSQTVIS